MQFAVKSAVAVYHPGWEANSYWVGRPWAYGWYGGAPVAWATAANVVSSASIVSTVNASVAVQSPLIVVPYSPYRLNYASVLALPNGRVSFNDLAAGVASASQGDCRLGLLNGVAAVGPRPSYCMRLALSPTELAVRSQLPATLPCADPAFA